MRKLKLYVNLSQDGLVSPKATSWIELGNNYDVQKGIDKDFQSFYDSTDAILISEEAFESIIYKEPDWLFQFEESYIISQEMSKKKKVNANIHFIYDDLLKKIQDLKKSEGGDIWLVGGEELTVTLFDNTMIDEVTIILSPEILHDGVVPFFNSDTISTWQILESNLLKNGAFKTTYKVFNT